MPDNVNKLFTTGPTLLADIGVASYNGCTFSPLFVSQVSGTCIKDEAQRTVKYMEYSLAFDGYVTAALGQADTVQQMVQLRTLLTAQAGHLIYKGRGCDLDINPPGGGGTRDVVWGPVPELLEFQPLGGGLSAKVKWQCKIRIPEVTISKRGATGGGSAGPVNKSFVSRGGLALNMLQFNYETTISYNEDGFSSLSVRGTLEIPITRITQGSRKVEITADELRNQIDIRIMKGIDLSRFRVVSRSFNISRDKRTMDWEIRVEEKPYMDLPPGCTVARGTYNVRPAKAGMGLCLWLCTLRSTYTLRHTEPRRVAWLMFLDLMRIRMGESKFGFVPKFKKPAKNDEDKNIAPDAVKRFFLSGVQLAVDIGKAIQDQEDKELKDISKRIVWLVDFSYDEGLYLDSKSITFSATWRLTTTFSHILLASGIWKKVPEGGPGEGPTGNFWARSMRASSGSESWLANKVDPKLDIIVDFGS